MSRIHTLIIGAGPAGLTAAVELARAGVQDIVVIEASRDFGGLSKTVVYQGNRIDIGGHRFFSKSDWVMDWWRQMLPLSHQEVAGSSAHLAYQGQARTLPLPAESAPERRQDVMLLRSRLSRIFFAGQFFDYPLKPNFRTAWQLGPARCTRYLLSYAAAQLRPRRQENTLEDFFINRFGRGLYEQFFKAYTEKVWGRSCDQISAAWGAQRVKSLSIGTAVWHALVGLVRRSPNPASPDSDAIAGQTPTSLIERFLYPKYGPGQMWEQAAQVARKLGVTILTEHSAESFELEQGRVSAVGIRRVGDEALTWLKPQHVISTMPIRDLVRGLGEAVPPDERAIGLNLEYRDFMTVGLLYRRMRCGPQDKGTSTGETPKIIPDNWVYIQEPGVQVGRLQVFNNWSPWLVRDPNTVWVGLEYFCQEGDELWQRSDDAMRLLALSEMQRIGLADSADCLDGVVIRMPKAYPGYYGSYAQFDVLRAWLDNIPNLFLIGRNGMHRYNNQDHSMLSAKHAVQAILSGSHDKSAIWNVNIDDDYHETVNSKGDQPRETWAPSTA